MGDSDPLSRATALTDMVEYQTGAVVSRTLVKQQSGTVTLFAFDRGEGLSEHTTPFDALLIVADGHAEITISGAAQDVRAGQLILLPAHEPHAVKAISRCKMLLVMLR